VTRPCLRVRIADELRFFLSVRHRRAEVIEVEHDRTSSLGHVVQSLGVPLTEVGSLSADGRTVHASHRPSDGETAEVAGIQRPQPVPAPHCPPRFVLDVHLGALARRLRLVGVDAAYRNDATDDSLLAQANDERRVLLTQDRGLLRRRALWLAGYVRGARPDAQLHDVIERFAPPLLPWTRCMACDGVLIPTAKPEIDHLIQPGTRRTYDSFARCPDCGRVYWRGAHSGKLEATVRRALAARPSSGAPVAEGPEAPEELKGPQQSAR
jgi:uncharacterized protein with PIN domain